MLTNWLGKANSWGTVNELDEENDLIVVERRVSGLSAAYFFRQTHGTDKKILIVENHDYFGGHVRSLRLSRD